MKITIFQQETIIDTFTANTYEEITETLTLTFGGIWDMVRWNTTSNGVLIAKIKIGSK